MNRTTSEMILKMLKAERKQKDWVDYIPTVAFALRMSKHTSTNYEPLLLMIGHKLKLPSEVTEVYPEDVFQIPDLSADKIEELSQHITELKFHEMVKTRDDIFDEVNENIKKSQQHQKRNYDLCHSSENMIHVGDVVLKERQRDLSRKGGKFSERYNESTYTVVKIKKNGNCVIKSNKSGDILATPCPLKHLKKFFKWPFDGESDDSMEDRMATKTSTRNRCKATQKAVQI